MECLHLAADCDFTYLWEIIGFFFWIESSQRSLYGLECPHSQLENQLLSFGNVSNSWNRGKELSAIQPWLIFLGVYETAIWRMWCDRLTECPWFAWNKPSCDWLRSISPEHFCCNLDKTNPLEQWPTVGQQQLCCCLNDLEREVLATAFSIQSNLQSNIGTMASSQKDPKMSTTRLFMSDVFFLSRCQFLKAKKKPALSGGKKESSKEQYSLSENESPALGGCCNNNSRKMAAKLQGLSWFGVLVFCFFGSDQKVFWEVSTLSTQLISFPALNMTYSYLGTDVRYGIVCQFFFPSNIWISGYR